MAIDPEIQAAIQAIDRKIAKLQSAKDLLISEFANAPTETDGGPPRPSSMSGGPPEPSFRNVFIRPEPPSTRKDQITNFLKENGPSTRREIVSKTGIPEGTVSYVLNDSDTFRHLDKLGKWELVEEKD